MRLNHRLLRVISLGILVLLIGSTFLTPTVRAAGLWYVSQSGDDTHDCFSPATACATIDGALAKITPGDTINVDTGTYTSSGSAVVNISIAVTLSGGWNADFTTRTGYTTVDGQNARLGMDIGDDDFDVIIQHFIVQNSYTGIITEYANLTLDHCIIQDNHDPNALAGGILSNYSGTLTIIDSSISGNTSSEVGGIRLWMGVPNLIIRNSSITGNSADYVGAVTAPIAVINYIENTTISGNAGGIYAGALNGTFEVFSSTIAGNSSTDGAGGIRGNLSVLHNSILAGNSSPTFPNCFYSLVSAGYNLFGDLTGCTVALQPGDLSAVDPDLGLLQGDPAYHYLLPTSPAVDAGSPSGCLDHSGASLTADQRGLPRFGRCDIGAVELQPLEYSTFQVDHEDAHLNQVLTYTASLRTGGAETLTGVTLVNTLPAGITYLPNSLQASSGAALYQSGKITWSGDLAPGSSVILTYLARAGAVAEVENMVVITSASETVSRLAVVEITPWFAYLPAVRKPCPAFFEDYFTNPNSGWWTTNTNNFSAQYLPGEYQLLMKVPEYFAIARAPSGPLPNDFQVQFDLRNVTGVLGSSGLMFGAAEDWSTLFTFEILPDQTWVIWKYQDYYGWEIQASGSSSAIRTGSQLNSIMLRHTSVTFDIYVNNQAVTSFTVYDIFEEKYVGLTAQSFDAAPLDMRFTNFIIPESSCALSTLLPAASPTSSAPGGFFAGPASRPAPKTSR